EAAKDQALAGGKAAASSKAVSPKSAPPAVVGPYRVIRLQKGEESSGRSAGETKAAADKSPGDKPLTPSSHEEKRVADQTRGGTREAARQLVARARDEFDHDRFATARLLFDEAHRIDKSVTDKSRDQWAYCKLHHAVEQLNRKDAANLAWSDLEAE